MGAGAGRCLCWALVKGPGPVPSASYSARTARACAATPVHWSSSGVQPECRGQLYDPVPLAWGGVQRLVRFWWWAPPVSRPGPRPSSLLEHRARVRGTSAHSRTGPIALQRVHACAAHGGQSSARGYPYGDAEWVRPGPHPWAFEWQCWPASGHLALVCVGIHRNLCSSNPWGHGCGALWLLRTPAHACCRKPVGELFGDLARAHGSAPGTHWL